MTESVSGPALSQAHAHHGATRYYSHLQSHTRSEHHHHDHQHLHHHQGSIRSPGHAHRILERDDSQPVVIVETVSIIQVIDSTGATVNVQTVSTTSDPSPTQSLTHTTLADQTSISASASTPEPSSGVSSYPGSSPDYDPTPQPTDSSSTSPGPTVTPPESGMPSSFPTLSYSPVTSTHLSHPHGFPSHSGVTNSSLTRSTTIASGNSSSTTTTLLSYTTTVSNGSTLTIPLTETSFTTSDASSTDDSSSSTFFPSETTTDSASFSSVSATPTSSGGSQTLETEPLAGTPTSTTAASGQSSGSTEGPTTAVVAGSVVGAFAGIAFLLLAAFYFLRWKKRHDGLKAIGGAGAAGVDRGLAGGGGPSGPSSGAAAAMSEESHSTPFAIPAALASLAGYKRNSRPRSSTGGTEGGFQKVSGRKLPSVLTSGGDGYTDPRDTMMSNESNPTYRDSMAIFGGSQPPPRFALGSPMRPESGVPVLQTGPARTPVMDQGPFSDYGPYRDDSPTLEPPMLDPLGRSRISQDGSSRSHMSGSRFYEDL